MARYLDVGKAIARRVRSGELAAGTELPAIREAAAEYAATPATIARAYRYLADGGVITIADRRRARVTTHAHIAAAHLLEADRVFRLAGSDDLRCNSYSITSAQPSFWSAPAAASPDSASWPGAPPTGQLSTRATSAASTTPPLPPHCSGTEARCCCDSGDVNRASSLPRAIHTA
jgi:DNA-binding transcriptional MocR family regulator